MIDTDKNSIFYRPNTIAPQNFEGTIAICIISVILSYAGSFCPEPYKNIIFSTNMAVRIAILFFFRKYIQNFHAEDTWKWINWNIVILCAILSVLVFARNILPVFDEQQKQQYTSLKLTFAVMYVCLIVVAICATIKLGMSMQTINNDFVGLLKKLGKIYICVEAPGILLFTILEVIKALRHSLPINLAANTVSILPTTFMIVIFFRAKKYRTENILSLS